MRFAKLALLGTMLVLQTSWVWAQEGGSAAARQHALALEQRGSTAEAEQAWQAIAEAEIASRERAEAYAHLGVLEAQQQHLTKAIAYYREAFNFDPELPGLQMNLGLALFKANDFRGAIKPFGVELRRHPGDQRLMILLGMAHYGMADYLVAIPYLQQAAANDPQNLPLRLTLAHSCLWSRQYPCVMEAYKQILALNGESAEADMLAGEALDAGGDFTGAAEQFRAAGKASPKEPNVHFGLGYLLWKQSQLGPAAKEFEAELGNDPDHVEARAYLGDCYVQLSDFTTALPQLEKVAEQPSGMIHRDLGIVYANLGRNSEAEAELRKAIALDPNDVAPHWRLGKLYQSMGRRDEAKAEYTAASAMNKESEEALSDKIAAASARPPT